MNIGVLIYIMVFMPMVGAFLSYLIGRKSKKGRDRFVSILTIIEFICALLLVCNFKSVDGVIYEVPEVCGMGLLFTADGFRVIYGAIAAFMWMMSSLFSAEYFAHYRNRNRYYLFQLLTLGATEAVFLSADLFTTFIFFELMSLASYVWVAQDEKKESLRAASTYLAVAVIGGLVMLMGLFLLYHQAGTLQINLLHEACEGKNVYAAAICLFVGFGAKAGAYPLHIWLPKAHPVAPAPASALLSGILTKTGIFGILVISSQILLHDEPWGAFVLVVGMITMFLGALLAVFSMDLKRTLACSSVSQIGFILVGVGMQGLLRDENYLAVRGTFLHMVNHSMFKLVLFLLAGVVFMNVHKLDLNAIRGFGRKKPLLAGIYLMGALGIGGIPFFSGYVSKTLLHESMVEYIHGMETGTFVSAFFTMGNMKAMEWIFLMSGGLTVAYMCKLFIAIFIEKNTDTKVQETYDGMRKYMNPVSTIALTCSAILIPLMGMLPYHTMDVLADKGQEFMGVTHMGHQVQYFTWTNLKGSIISILIGAFVYVIIVRGWMMKKQENKTKVYVNRWYRYFDLEDYVYRPLLLTIFTAIGSIITGILDILVDGLVVILRKTIYRDSVKEVEPEEGNEVTHTIGMLLDRLEDYLNKTVHKNKPHQIEYEHGIALRFFAFKENVSFIGRSLSFGLILFCVGLCVTLLYLLLSAVL